MLCFGIIFKSSTALAFTRQCIKSIIFSLIHNASFQVQTVLTLRGQYCGNGSQTFYWENSSRFTTPQCLAGSIYIKPSSSSLAFTLKLKHNTRSIIHLVVWMVRGKRAYITFLAFIQVLFIVLRVFTKDAGSQLLLCYKIKRTVPF